MYLVDSCGWLEWFTEGPLAEEYRPYLERNDELLIPAIVLYEVYKVLKRGVVEDKALLAVGYMKNAPVIPLDANLALRAADIALQHRLAMADAIVFATALTHECLLITSDSDLQGLNGVKYLPK